MKLRCLRSILIASLIASPAFAEDAAGERQHEPAGGYSLVPPAGWQAHEFPGLKYRVFTGPPVGGFAPNLNVVDEYFPGSLDDYVGRNLLVMARMFQAFEKLSQNDFELNSGDRAVRIVAKSVQDPGLVEQSFYFVDGGGGRYFVITCGKLATDERQVAQQCDGSARTFRVDGP